MMLSSQDTAAIKSLLIAIRTGLQYQITDVDKCLVILSGDSQGSALSREMIGSLTNRDPYQGRLPDTSSYDPLGDADPNTSE